MKGENGDIWQMIWNWCSIQYSSVVRYRAKLCNDSVSCMSLLLVHCICFNLLWLWFVN